MVAGLAVLATLTVWLVAFEPGVFSVDSLVHYAHASDLKPLSNVHPYTYSVIYAALLGVWDSPTVMPVFQALVLSVVVGSATAVALRRGVPPWKVAVFVLVYLVHPVFGIYTVTVWKDVLFAYVIAGSMLGAFTLAVTRRESYPLSVLCGVALTYVALLRFNGVAFAFSLPVLLLAFRALDWRRAGTMLLTLLVAYGALGVAVPRIAEMPEGELLSEGPYLRLVGALYADADAQLDSSERAVFESVMPEQEWKDDWDPKIVDELIHNAADHSPTNDGLWEPLYDDPERMDSWRDAALRAAASNPGIIIKDKVTVARYLLGLTGTSYKYDAWIVAEGAEYDIVEPPQRPETHQWLMDWLKTTSAQTVEEVPPTSSFTERVVNFFFWAPLVPTLIIAATGSRAFVRGRRVTAALAAALLLNLAPILLLAPAVSFRYVFWLYVAAPVLVLLHAVERRHRPESNSGGPRADAQKEPPAISVTGG